MLKNVGRLQLMKNAHSLTPLKKGQEGAKGKGGCLVATHINKIAVGVCSFLRSTGRLEMYSTLEGISNENVCLLPLTLARIKRMDLIG